MTTYVDGSAVLERIVAGEGSDVAAEVWRRARTVASSAIAYPEARGLLARAHDQGELGDHDMHEAAGALERVFADLELVAVDADLAVTAGGLAEQHGLEALDALHLAAALSLDATRVVVATWSPSLAAAASECGLAIVPRQPARAAA